MAKSIQEIRAGIPAADQEPWDGDFFTLVNDLLDLNQALLDALAEAGGGAALVLAPRPTAEIMAYANPFPGLLCQGSDTGLWWAYYGGAWQLLDKPRLMASLAVTSLLPDEQASAVANTTFGGLTFGNSSAWAWGDFKVWLDGVAWRVVLEGLMTTGSASAVVMRVAYLVAGSGAINGLVKTRWAASTAYALNDLRIPSVPNGHYYKCTTAGTSAASAPTWNTGSGGTTSDGGVVWTEQGVSFKHLEVSVIAPANAYQRFSVDSANLQIPAAEVSVGDRVFFGLWRSGGDDHGGDLVLVSLNIQPVEA
ncbi:MAG: hypothetical protein HY910_12150 [Desulfarculus sp.]|nr:hypothetical protein [Desulfarculus sp.]